MIALTILLQWPSHFFIVTQPFYNDLSIFITQLFYSDLVILQRLIHFYYSAIFVTP
jgi:hypothetical protein